MRNITSDNIVHMEKRATNKFGLFLVVVAVLIIFGGGGFLVYKYRDRIDWNIKFPWENISKESVEEEKSTSSKKKKKRELIVPRIKSTGFYEGNTLFSITKVEADDRGYLFTASLLTKSSWATISIEAILIDGYYTSTKLEMSDEGDLNEQVATTKQFRITQTELDNLNIHGFNLLSFYFVIEEPGFKTDPSYEIIEFGNDVGFKNGREGLIKVDDKGKTLIEYYQTVKADDATYIYFEGKNRDLINDRQILIKKLLINDRIYEMPEFEKIIFKGAKDSFFIKIPKDKIKDVESFLVSFYIINKNDKGELKGAYITNEYSKTF